MTYTSSVSRSTATWPFFHQAQAPIAAARMTSISMTRHTIRFA